MLHDGLADIAVEEQPRAVLGEPGKHFGKLFVAEGLAGLHQLAARREDLRDAFARGENGGDDGEEIGLELGQGEACPRRPHRGLDQAFHREPAQRLVHGEEAGHHAGRRARPEPDMELLLGRAKIGVDGKELDLIRRAPLARGLAEEVEHCGLVASGPARHEETAAPRRGEHGLGDEGHEHAGQRSVEGVAAVLQDFGGGVCGQLMPRRNDGCSIPHPPRLSRSG